MLTVHGAPRADTDSGPILADRLRDRFQDLQREPRPVLDCPSVLVRPLIRYILQELVNQVPVRAVEHDTIEPSLVHSDFSCPLVPSNVLLDLRDGKRSGNDAGTAPLDGRWTNWDNTLTGVIGFENPGLRGWANGPELGVDK